MDILHQAQQYIRAGFSVIPIQTDGSKEPVGSWSAYCNRYASEHELLQWFGQAEQAGIGIVTGSISGSLLVIDFDYDAEQTFARFWQDIQQQLPGITDSLLVISTPRPGRQVWIRCETPPPNSTVLAYSEPVGEPPQPVPKVETRGHHAYAVAPGGPDAVHPTGRPYQIIHGNIEHLPQLPDATVDRLLDICRSYSEWTPQHVQQRSGKPYTGEPRPGDIYNQQADLRQLLLDADWSVHHTDADGSTEYLTRPGKQTPGFSATLGKLRTEDGKPLLYVFSTNAAPFEQHQAYDAFAAYAMLKHRGDFGQAAAAVRILYADQLKQQQQAFHAAVAEQIPDGKPYKMFPVDCLPEPVAAYAAEHAAAIGIDVSFVTLPLLATLAACIGSSRSLYLKRNYHQPATLWTATIAEPSTGKSPGWEAGTAPAAAIEKTIHVTASQEQTRYEQALAEHRQAVVDGTATAANGPAKPEPAGQFVVADVTMESLVDIHQRNAKLLLSCDELAGWLKRMDQYRPGADCEQWLSIFNGGSISVNRKTDGYRVWLPRTSICVTGTIQPKVAQELLFSERFIGNGFVARILTAAPPAAIVRWTDNEVAEQVDATLYRLAQQLYLLPGEPCGTGTQPMLLPCTDAARQAFIRWTNEAADHAEQLQPDLRNSWLKLRPTAGRFALQFAVCRQLLQHPDGQATQPVDLESMTAGIQLAWWFGYELERNAAADDQATLRQHLQWIHRYHATGLDCRTLIAGRRSITTAEDARRVFQQLVASGAGQLTPAGLFVPNPVT